MKSTLIILIAISWCLFSRAVLAQGLTGPPVIPTGDPPPSIDDFKDKTSQLDKSPYFPYQKEVNRRLGLALIPYDKKSSEPALVGVDIDPNGLVRPEGVIFRKGTGSLILDFACFDAVLSASPFDHVPSKGGWNSDYSFYQDSFIRGNKVTINKITNTSSTLARSYFKNHPKQAGKVVLTRSIPSSVLFRYPNVFSESEIDSQKNLKAIKLTLFDKTHESEPATFKDAIINKKILDRYQNWISFEEKHTTATRAQILDQEKLINDKYADLFKF